MTRPVTRVLHVEDDDNDADLVTLALESVCADWRSRVRYIRARDFAGGLSAIVDDRPHVVLLDINLPGRSGHELLAQIKSHRATRHIPVIIFSNSADDSEIVACYQKCASAYLTKPRTFAALKKMMGSVEKFWFQVASLPDAQSHAH